VYNVDRLRAAFRALKPGAAAGIDGQTWRSYGQDLERNLQDLSDRLKRGAYRAKPVRRVYIPKPDGRQRPLGVPVLEDKLVQRATTEVLQTVHETDFKGFSYGFRPGRGAHHALDALTVGIKRKKVNWVLDADIRAFFDTIDHTWMVKFIEHRIADRRVVRHIQKWLNAGVMEDGRHIEPETGTPQGGSISPLLANIYLHYVFDLWADQWRHRQARGDVIIVRYADDFVVGFEHHSDAERFLTDLGERFRRFGLELHATKTRVLEFGRYASKRRKRRGLRKPETFNFLGFTHICAQNSRGWFEVLRRTQAQRMRAKLRALKETLRQRMHWSVAEVGRWLGLVLQGHYRYYGVPYNYTALKSFHFALTQLWRRTLLRRSQKSRLTWEHMARLIRRHLPSPRIVHPYPERRIRYYPRQEPSAVVPLAGICAGGTG
jgi:group II intron reverse transcriptase/maturase